MCVLILAMDTCDARGSVALVEFAAAKLPEQTVALPDASVLALEAHLTGEDYSTWLLPAVELVLQVTGKRLDEVNVVAAAAGSGAEQFGGVGIHDGEGADYERWLAVAAHRAYRGYCAGVRRGAGCSARGDS